MAEPESAEYQGRRRAPVPALRGTVLVAGGIGVAVLVLLSLVVIVLTAPQKSRQLWIRDVDQVSVYSGPSPPSGTVRRPPLAVMAPHCTQLV